MEVLQAGLFATLIFVVIDGLWIGIVAAKFYQKQMGELLRPKIDFVPAAIFYASYLAAMVWLIVLPALREGGWPQAALNGAILGFVAYGTYDLTNLSTLKGYPLKLALVDLSWGTALTAITSAGATALTLAF